MRPFSRFAFLSALLVTVWIVPASSQDPPKIGPPQGLPAVEPAGQDGVEPKSLKATLLITADPSSNLAQAALLSSVASDPMLIKQALKLVEKAVPGSEGSPKDAEKTVGQLMIRHPRSIAPGLAMLEVRAKSLREGVTAEEIVSKYANELKNRLTSLDTPHMLLELRGRTLEDRLLNRGTDLKKGKDALVTMAAINHISVEPQANEQRRERLDAQLEAISVEIVGLEARKKVLEEQIAKQSGAPADGGQDAVAEELEKAVSFRSAQLARLKTLRNSNSVAEAAVNEGELGLAAAKAELAKYRREAGRIGDQRMTELRRRLDDTAIEMAEATSKKEVLAALLQEASRFSGDFDLKRLEIEQRENEYRAVGAELAAVTLQIQSYIPPSVMLLSPQ